MRIREITSYNKYSSRMCFCDMSNYPYDNFCVIYDLLELFTK